MKEFQNIEKKMPFAEDKDYINNLISKSTEVAINQGKDYRKSFKMWIASAAASIVILTGIGITYFHSTTSADITAENTSSPIEQFLNNITDEEVQMIAYYEIEDIPEY